MCCHPHPLGSIQIVKIHQAKRLALISQFYIPRLDVMLQKRNFIALGKLSLSEKRRCDVPVVTDCYTQQRQPDMSKESPG
jgi:hypothetical protein